MRVAHITDYKAFKRVIVFAVITLMLFIAGFSIWKAVVEYRLTLKAADLQTHGYAQALKEHAERTFNESDSILLDAIEHIKEHGGIDKEDSQRLRFFLLNHTHKAPQVASIILVNRHGLLFAHSLDAPVKNANVADREYFIHHRDHPEDDTPFLSRPIKSRINGKWRFTISRPVRSASGVFEGVVAVAFDMDYFQKFYSSLDLGKKGRIVILRKDGVMLLSQPYKETDFLVDFKKSHLFRTYLPQSSSGTFHIAGGKALLEPAGRIISYVSLDSFPVVVNANMGIDEVTGAWRRGAYTQVIITLAACAGLIMLMFALLRQIKQIEESVEERDKLEMQLRQTQKMEAIGHLAGGIAHDFNNLLTPIMGYAEMAAATIAVGDRLAPKLAGIIAAANKAKALTHQLLSFGRRQSLAAEVLDLNEIILSFNIILRRTIRESIRIDLLLDPEGAFVKCDRSQMEQIILNMTVNAQDAFDGAQGKICIETCKILMDGENARLHPGMVPGTYLLLSFRDNGCGMSEDVVNHIFEPFFTTKQVGHGTGLGLATVYGIVKQHDAFISVISHPGDGTTFNIYFPPCGEVPLMLTPVEQTPRRKNSGEIKILVVEDNDMVRKVVQEMLQGAGYSVFSAADPHKAIELLSQSGVQIDLLVSDVVMPGMNGPELYEQLIVQMPALKVVFISGYPVNPTLRGGTFGDDVNYLQKPFTAAALLERIHMVL